MQAVVVTRLADCHATLHDRDFAESREVTVPRGSLADVLRATAEQVSDLDVARYSLTIGEPFDVEGDRS